MSFNILVVDDAAFIREALIQICREAGHHVVGEASNGIEAVEKAVALKPNVILMDIVMPLKNGVEAAAEILEKLPRVKIIACSTVDQEFMAKKALQVGCVSFISKPFKKKDIIEAIGFIKLMNPEAP
jgi:two-component system, chemotaxis family, chemotaxis protein CheY